MTTTTYAISNPREATLNSSFMSYFDKFFSDNNKYIVRKYANLDENAVSSEVNVLKMIQLMKLKFNQDIVIAADELTIYRNILSVAMAMYHLIDTESGIEQYRGITQVNVKPNSTTTTTPKIRVTLYPSTTLPVVYYNLNSDSYILTVFIDDDDTTINFTKSDTFVYSDTDILKNHVQFLTSFNPHNAKTEIYAFCYFMLLFQEFARFHQNCTNLLTATTDVCSYFTNNLTNNLKELKNFISNIDTNATLPTTLIPTEYKLTQLCPIKLELNDSNDSNRYVLDKDSQVEELSKVMIETRKYNILSALYTDIENTNTKFVSSVIINASVENTTCDNINKYEFNDLEYAQNDVIDISFQPKLSNDFRKDYLESGKELGKLNEQIDISKNKINKISDSYKVQQDAKKTVDTRMYIYIAIIAIIMFVMVLALIVKNDKKIKLIVGGTSFVILLIMNIFNYSTTQTYIEAFTTPPTCPGSDSTISVKKDFVSYQINIMTDLALEILQESHVKLSTLDSHDILTSVSKSLKEEKRAFIEYDDIYKKKYEMNKSTVDIMKLELHETNEFVDFITMCFLLITVLYIFIAYDDKFAVVYLVIISILLFVIIYKYYYDILQPTRTKSDNMYWKNPASIMN